MSRVIFRAEIDNIFDFYFMDDFTTIELAEDEYKVDTSKLKDKNGFYCFSEKKSYKPEELYEKFNIEIVANPSNKK